MFAALTSIKEAEIDKEEADKLAKGIANVARHYNVPGVAQKTKDWIMLMQTLGVIYVPRAIAFNIRRNAEKPRPVPVPAIAVGMSPARQATPSQAPTRNGGPRFVDVPLPDGGVGKVQIQ